MTHVETEMRLSVIYIIKLVLNNKLWEMKHLSYTIKIFVGSEDKLIN